MDLLHDTWNAVGALSRLGRSQLLLVFTGAAVSTVLAGICTNWGGSAFFATIAFLICDVVNAMYSITYENTFAFTSLAVLLVEQNAVLTASTAVGIMNEEPHWAKGAELKWIAVAFGWVIVTVLFLLQLALRKDWGWHAHKLGLARTEDVALYQRILQLEGAILLDFCQVVPSCVVLLGKYGFSADAAEHITRGSTDSKLAHVVAILFFIAAIVSVICAPILGSSARRENTTPFGIAGFLTMCTTGLFVFGAVDCLRRVGWPIASADAILVALVILTCIVRIILIVAILRIPQSVFGSGIAARINRGSDGVLLPSNIEGWSECRRSGFGGARSTAADTEGAAMLYGNIEDYSDTESQASARAFGLDDDSNPNLVYGERVRVRESAVLSQQQQRATSKLAQLHSQKVSILSSSSNQRNNVNGSSSNNNNAPLLIHHDRVESTNSMSTLHRQSSHNATMNSSLAASPTENNINRGSSQQQHQQQTHSQQHQSNLGRNSSYLGGNDDETIETSSNQSRTRGGKSPNTISYVKANVRKK